MEAGLGLHNMWGLSPAVDLNQHVRAPPPSQSSSDEERTRHLLLEPGDLRHVLCTFAKHRTSVSSQCGLEFHVSERTVEGLARHLLLLQIAFDWSLPIRRRACIFLEVFGNAKVQQRTERYISALSLKLIDLVCNNEGGLAAILDISRLKYRTRDDLVNTFRAWHAECPFDVVGLRDRRLRALFGERYDSRNGVVDWDYQSGIRPHASVIHAKQYKEWRLTGVGFEFGDQEYACPNRSMGSYTQGIMKKGKDKGIKKEIRGFWLDVVNGPFYSFGIRAEETDENVRGLFEIQNRGTGVEQHRHNTVEVATYNIISWLWQIETGTQYRMKKAHDIFSGLSDGTEERSEAAEQDTGALRRARSIVQALSTFRLILLLNQPENILLKPPIKCSYQTTFFSATSVHSLEHLNVETTMNPGGSIMIETAQLVVPLSREQRAEYEQRVLAMVEPKGFQERALHETGSSTSPTDGSGARVVGLRCFAL